MTPAVMGLAGLLLGPLSAAAQYPPPYAAATSGQVPFGGCEVRPDAPYINPRLPLGRGSYSHRPACRTTWASGPSGPGLYVQGPPVQVEAPPVNIGGLVIYVVPPEIVVLPSEVTLEAPQVLSAPPPTPAAGATDSDD